MLHIFRLFFFFHLRVNGEHLSMLINTVRQHHQGLSEQAVIISLLGCPQHFAIKISAAMNLLESNLMETPNHSLATKSYEHGCHVSALPPEDFWPVGSGCSVGRLL